MSINQRNPNSNHAKARSEHGVVHYLALTFSTLLSSQVSGTHRAEFLVLGLGQRPTVRGLRGSSQTASSWLELLVPPNSVSSPGFDELCERTYPKISSASGFLRVGRHRSTDLLASRTPLRPHLLYACVPSRSNHLAMLSRCPNPGR
jgi:hypothetical protein